MKQGIYAIIDHLTNEIVGTFLHVMKHEAVAVRMFTDVATDPTTNISKHMADYSLVRLGWLMDSGNMTPEITNELHVVLEGKTLLATLQRENKQ